MKKKKTNTNIKIDSELWERLGGLAKFKALDRTVLLEEAIIDRLEKENSHKCITYGLDQVLCNT